MYCPRCNETMEKARLDVYWCYGCNEAWLIHKLSTYKSLKEASRVVTKEEIWDAFTKDKFSLPPKPRSGGETDNRQNRN